MTGRLGRMLGVAAVAAAVVLVVVIRVDGKVDVTVTLDDVRALAPSAAGWVWQGSDSTPDLPSGTPEEAGTRVQKFLAGNHPTPAECADRMLTDDFVTTADATSHDPISYLGNVGAPDPATLPSLAWMGLTARVFETPADATDFVHALQAAARACPDGYTNDLTPFPIGNGMTGTSGRTSAGAVHVTSGTRRGGGLWVLVEQDRVSDVKIDGFSTWDSGTYYFAYGNVVVAIDRAWNIPLLQSDLDTVVQSVVDQLGRYPGGRPVGSRDR